MHTRATAAAGLAAAVLTAAVLTAANPSHPVPMTIRGIVAGSYFTPPDGPAPSTTVASYYQGATVCADINDNGACDVHEASTVTDLDGSFFLHSLYTGPLVVEASTLASNSGHPLASRLVLRAVVDQIAEGASNAGHAATTTPLNADVVVTPLSTEVARMMDADGVGYQTARQRLATRLTVPVDHLLTDPNAEGGPVQTALLRESVILTNRFTLAAKMLDRGDVASIKAGQQAAMNLESIPRYDHLFVIFLENKNVAAIKGSPFAPNINHYLTTGNQLTNYYATGNPSEPNYTAVGAGDDFGIADDSAWNCVPAGDTADLPDDPLPTGLSPCTNSTNHNIKNRANVFNALTADGMTWRVYNESMNPGRDWRLNSAADATILAPDHVYPAGSPVGAIGNPDLMLRLPSGAYATKHNNVIPFQNVRSASEFVSSNRTMGGGQWDEAFRNAGLPPGWDLDQLGTDLARDDLATLNILVPDQCDDMHGLTVTGPITGTNPTVIGTASDCSGSANIYRGDLYVRYLIDKIQASPVWTNSQKRVAIVIMFDEGNATTGLNSCCGWNPVGKPGYGTAGPLGVLVRNPDGTTSVDTSVVNYGRGNKGHGTSIFGVLTNQAAAPRGVVDSDAYSHMSLVRTLQDMFQLADPGDDWSYMNRSKYTEAFIAANSLMLPEYAGSPNPHFDAVRPMNHAYVNPSAPDSNQLNVWALK